MDIAALKSELTTDPLASGYAGMGDDIDVSAGTNARTVMLAAFGAGTVSRTALAALTTRRPASRAQHDPTGY